MGVGELDEVEVLCRLAAGGPDAAASVRANRPEAKATPPSPAKRLKFRRLMRVFMKASPDRLEVVVGP